MIAYKTLQAPEEFQDIQRMEMLVWQIDASEAVPGHMSHILALCGGHVQGAYDGDTMIGFSLALPARMEGRWMLWSHMAAVNPAYQRQGIGRRLKMNQRAWAIEQGFTHIGWTFMPLMRQNANFNLNVLGGHAYTYHPNFYGPMHDSLNEGMPSDRLIVTWELENPRVIAHATGEIAHLSLPLEIPALLTHSEAGEPEIRPIDWHTCGEYLTVEVPYDTLTMMRDDLPQAQRWCYAVREVFTLAFERHYCAIDFVTQESRCWYVLRRQKTHASNA